MPGDDWLLVKARTERVIDPTFHPVLWAYEDLLGREQRAGIRPDTPILVSPDLEWDRGLALYFNTCVAFIGLNRKSKVDEGREIKGWLTYLHGRGVHWLDASETHYERFRALRTERETVLDLIDAGAIEHEPGTPLPVISIRSFENTYRALKRLYKWAYDRGLLDGYSPIPEQNRDGARAARDTSPKDQWMLPDAYRLWRDVGIAGAALERDSEGRLTAGLTDPSWKGGAVASRNLAFVDLMVGTGLRMEAAATILTIEVPQPGGDARSASAVTKFGRGYAYTPTP